MELKKAQFRSDMTVELIDRMGDDKSIVRAARVSTATDTITSDDARDLGLIRYLMDHRHGSPFEHGVMTWRIEAPLFVFREFQRHRIASYNEQSGRYSTLDGVFYVPHRHRQLQQVGKPGEYKFKPGTDEQYKDLVEGLRRGNRVWYQRYQTRLQHGIAKEVARMDAPLNLYSSMYVTMNVRALMNFLSLRIGYLEAKFPSSPMREIEVVAVYMEEDFFDHFPDTANAFYRAGMVAP